MIQLPYEIESVASIAKKFDHVFAHGMDAVIAHSILTSIIWQNEYNFILINVNYCYCIRIDHLRVDYTGVIYVWFI